MDSLERGWALTTYQTKVKPFFFRPGPYPKGSLRDGTNIIVPEGKLTPMQVLLQHYTNWSK